MNALIKTIVFLFFLSINSYSQVLPISKETKNGSTDYYTNLTKNYQGFVDGQSKEKISKIRREVTKSNIDFKIYNSCFTTLRINKIVDNKAVIIISYYTNESGIIYAASLSNYENRILLTDEEVKCILTKAMTQKVNFIFTEGLFPFYIKLSHSYNPNVQFTNPKVAPDPSNPTGDPDYK
jgi:hypothetical protein